MSKFKSNKLFPVFVAFSAVVIIAGIILYALLGFNAAQDKSLRYILEVRFDSSLNTEGQTQLFEKTEDILDGLDISYEKELVKVFTTGSSSLIGETSYKIAHYELSGDNETAFKSAVEKIEQYVAENSEAETSTFFRSEISVSYSQLENLYYNTAAWRGAIAVAVGAIVALIYVAIRFGVSCGVAGLVCCTHDALFTLAIFAIARIPVFSLAPVLYAAIAAFVSAVLWTLFASRIRSNYKEPEFAALNAEEVASRTKASSWKFILLVAALFAGAIVILGAVAVGGTMALLLPAILAAVVPVYSALLIGPRVFAAVRKGFDKKRAAKKGGYVGKKKKAEISEE